MASNQNFGSSGFLFGSNLVETKGFLNSQGVCLGSAFGTSIPSHALWRIVNINLFVIKAKIEQPTNRAKIMNITKNFGWVKDAAFAFSILNVWWLIVMDKVWVVVQGEVWDEKLTGHQYMTLIEKWHLQECQALSWFHCMRYQNKSILHNFLAYNLFQCYHRLYTQMIWVRITIRAENNQFIKNTLERTMLLLS